MLNTFSTVATSTNAIVSRLVFRSLTPCLFVFLLLRWRNCCLHCGLLLWLHIHHHFPSVLIQTAGCSLFGPVLTERPEVDAHRSFCQRGRKRDPRQHLITFVPYFLLFSVLPLFLASSSVLSGSLRFVAAGSDGGGVKCSAGLYKVRRRERMDEKEAQ